MPLFNWDAPRGESVLKSRFWVFWAVTIPLTLAVIGVWWLWMLWRESRDRIEDMRAGGVDKKD
jgi:hypothetical protein